MYLKQSNPFYLDTRIDIDNILDELLDLTEYIDQEIPIFVEWSEEGENPLDIEFRKNNANISGVNIRWNQHCSGEGKKHSSAL